MTTKTKHRTVYRTCAECGRKHATLVGHRSGRPPKWCPECRTARRSLYSPGYSRKFRMEKQRWIDEAKSRPCADCGVQFPPRAMDLDHVRGTKVANCAKLAVSGSKQALLDEIAKCEAVCACCHRLRHAGGPNVVY